MKRQYRFEDIFSGMGPQEDNWKYGKAVMGEIHIKRISLPIMDKSYHFNIFFPFFLNTPNVMGSFFDWPFLFPFIWYYACNGWSFSWLSAELEIYHWTYPWPRLWYNSGPLELPFSPHLPGDRVFCACPFPCQGMLPVWKKFFGKIRDRKQQTLSVEEEMTQEIAKGTTWWSGPMKGRWDAKKRKKRPYHINNLIFKSLSISKGNPNPPHKASHIQ